AGRPAIAASWPKADSAPLHSSRTTGSAASPVAVSRTPRPARSSSVIPKCASSRRICWLTAEEVMWRCRAAAATEPVRATASSVSSAGNRPASIMKRSLTFHAEPFTGLHGSGEAPYAPAREDKGGRRMARTLLDKVWEAHTVRTLPSGQTQLLIGLHLIHEATTPQAFQMLRDSKLKVRMPERTFGTLDHIIPTTDQARPYADPLAEEMAVHMIRNMKDFSLPLFDMSTGKQGIVHVIGPELGLSQPGMTIACGDSHTSTHGAMGAIAFGIGTTQVRDVLATQ